jgi:hypothetical protein
MWNEAGSGCTANDLETMGGMARSDCEAEHGDRSASSKYNVSDFIQLFQLSDSSDRAANGTHTSIDYCSVCIWWHVRVGLHVEDSRFTTQGTIVAMGWVALYQKSKV